MTLNARIMVGLAVGTLGGVLVAAAGGAAGDGGRWVAEYVADPAGQIWLRLLLMVVVPLVFATLVLGIAGLGDVHRLGRMGGRTLGLFLATTLLAALLGLAVVNVLAPGDGLSDDLRTQLLDTFADRTASTVEAAGADLGVSTFVNLVPSNPLAAAVNGDLIAFIVFTLVFGVALTRVPAAYARPMLDVLDAVARTTMVMIGFAMWLAPIGVACFAYSVTARLGLEILAPIATYFIAVLVGLIIYQFGVLGLFVRVFAGIRPRTFFSRSRLPMLTAFSTASSAATLPTTIRTAEEELGVPREVSGFVLPLGATLHMNGTAFFMSITIVFLAQAFGVTLGAGTQMMIAGMTVLTAVSAAGIPSGSIPLMVVILISVGVPGEAIGLIFGVEPLLGMARTSTNVTGDLFAAATIARMEGGVARPPGEESAA
ncbi:MAG: dicarboxylate/amino acid:cation symporter [Gemmatimonadota bacterium]|nr:dicarboxylate/amino acid:cation symporter [Gemmatimonadota bacterium]